MDEFFVYAMQTGDFRIEITWFGTVEVEYEAEVESDFDFIPEYRHSEKRTEERTVELSVMVVTDVLVEDGKVTDWSIVDASAEE